MPRVGGEAFHRINLINVPSQSWRKIFNSLTLTVGNEEALFSASVRDAVWIDIADRYLYTVCRLTGQLLTAGGRIGGGLTPASLGRFIWTRLSGVWSSWWWLNTVETFMVSLPLLSLEK